NLWWPKVGLEKCPVFKSLLKEPLRPGTHGVLGPAIRSLYVCIETVRGGIEPFRHGLLFLERRIRVGRVIAADGEVSNAVFPDIVDLFEVRAEFFFPRVIKSLRHDVLDGEIRRSKFIGNIPVILGITVFWHVKKILSVVRTQMVAIPCLEALAEVGIIRKTA